MDGVIVSSLISFLDSEFNNLQDQWEKSIVSELKLTEIGTKGAKKLLNGMTWPTLSLTAKTEVRLSPELGWKKASNTYSSFEHFDVSDDLASGVRNFFFYREGLTEEVWNKICSELLKHSSPNELEIFLLGEGKSFTHPKLKIIDSFVSGAYAHDQGGHSIQELGLLAKNLVSKIETLKDEVYLAVYLDSHFFHNIAKVRATRLLASKIILESNKNLKVKVVGLTSFTGWTMFERYSNMLRNETAVASGYIGGADHVQSTGYNAILELEADTKADPIHVERSHRMARNTAHVLGLESMLGVVGDASFGSYHLENLTQSLCEESWKEMQLLLKGKNQTAELQDTRNKRSDLLKTRKNIISGVNDYPDVKEELHLKLKAPKVFRVARVFEELRLKMESVKRPEVYIALYGDYGALNARLNFVKNYFELIGLTVRDPGHSELDLENFKKNLSSRKEEIVVLCAMDDQYPLIQDAKTTAAHKFIAGKVEAPGFKNLFGGQNIYDVLQNLVSHYEGKKS